MPKKTRHWMRLIWKKCPVSIAHHHIPYENPKTWALTNKCFLIIQSLISAVKLEKSAGEDSAERTRRTEVRSSKWYLGSFIYSCSISHIWEHLDFKKFENFNYFCTKKYNNLCEIEKAELKVEDRASLWSYLKVLDLVSKLKLAQCVKRANCVISHKEIEPKTFFQWY